MLIQNWGNVTYDALIGLWQGFLNFVPSLIGALIVFFIGWFIAIWVGKIVSEVLKKLKFNELFEKGNWDEALAKADIKVDASGFIGAIVKWILVIVFLIATVNILGLEQFAVLLQGILGYLPNVLVAAFLFIVTVIITDIVEKIVRVSVERTKVGYGHMVSMIIKWSIWVFAILAILQQLKFEAAGWVFELIKIAFIGIVAMFAISFGLGGKEVASKMVEELKDKMKK